MLAKLYESILAKEEDDEGGGEGRNASFEDCRVKLLAKVEALLLLFLPRLQLLLLLLLLLHLLMLLQMLLAPRPVSR